MPIAVDASVTAAWCFEDESSDYCEAALDEVGESAGFVPQIWPYEMANLLHRAVRTGRMTSAQMDHEVEWFESLPLVVEMGLLSLGEVVAMAKDWNLSSYDAGYLELARQRGVPIATQDKAMLKSAQAAGIKVFSP